MKYDYQNDILEWESKYPNTKYIINNKKIKVINNER